jgi:hypothetical protein
MLTLDGIYRQLDRFQNDPGLLQPRNLADRQEAFDFFTAARAFIQHGGAGGLKGEITWQISWLEERYQNIKKELFLSLREDIRSGYLLGSDIRIVFNDYTAYHPGQIGKDHIQTDELDILLNGLLEISDLPHAVLPRDSEMIHLEIAPASAILDMIDHAGLIAATSFMTWVLDWVNPTCWSACSAVPGALESSTSQVITNLPAIGWRCLVWRM